jgi:hypothetical protein
MLNVCDASETVMLGLEDPIKVVEWLGMAATGKGWNCARGTAFYSTTAQLNRERPIQHYRRAHKDLLGGGTLSGGFTEHKEVPLDATKGNHEFVRTGAGRIRR